MNIQIHKIELTIVVSINTIITEEKIEKILIDMEKIEVEKVAKLIPIERYKYFIKRVADGEIMFTLTNGDGNIIVSQIDKKMIVPFWSSTEFVELCKITGWENLDIKEISLDYFEDKIIDWIEENNYLLNIFPVENKTGFVVDINEFARDLSDELKKY